MIKTTGLVLLILGALALVVGVVGIFGNDLINISPYALIILGLVFFFAGTSMLKQSRDTDEI